MMSSSLGKSVLAGKVAFIAGGSSGINLGVAEGFAGAGAKVALISRSPEKIEAAAQGLRDKGHDAIGMAADVRDYAAVEAAIAATATRWGPIDIVLSGAAGNFIAPAAGISANGFKTVVDIDLLGTFNVFRASYDHIRKPGASLIAITAGQAVQPMAGVNMVTQCLAIEWGQFGVRVNAISPGPIADTEGMRRLIVSAEAEAAYKATLPMGHYGETWDIAELAIFLSTDSARYISGAIIPCDGASILTGGSQASFRAS